MPDLETELPGVPKLRPGANLASPETKITTLENGIKIASQEDYGQVSSMGVFVSAGSHLETEENNGLSYVLEKMAFRASQNRSGQEIVQTIEDIGGNVVTFGSREQQVFQLECLRSEIERGVDLLAENTINPLFLEEDLAETKEMIRFEEQELQYEPHVLIQEWLHEAAFGKKTSLGQPHMIYDSRLDKITPEKMYEFMRNYFVGSNIVIAAAGVDHDELVYHASKKFQSIPKSSDALIEAKEQ
eukprot:g3362.t1